MSSFLKDQAGRSVIEILGVLAVIGVLSIGGIAGYTKAMEKRNTNQLLLDVNATIQKINGLYNSQPSFENIDKNAWDLNLAANSRKGTGPDKKIYHILNGEVIIKSIALNKGFVMIYNGLTQPACTELASMDWGSAGSGLKYLVVSPTGVVPPRGFPSNLDVGEYSIEDLPLPTTEAASHCKCHPLFKCGIAWFFGK